LELQGIGAVGPVPDWLRGLIQAVRSEAIQPKDTRIKSLWDLLRQRQLLRRSPWLKAALHRIWNKGLSVRPRPRTASRIKRRLRLWGILPQKSVSAMAHRQAVTGPVTRAAVQAVRPVALKPVASVRPAAMQPVRPVQMQPTSLKAMRK
jgi:hypothetical protein